MAGVVVALREDSNYLLVTDKTGPFGGLWAPVHGSIEPGESPEQAGEREVSEEVGLETRLTERDRVMETHVDDGDGTLYWLATASHSGSVDLGAEIAEYAWLDPEAIRRRHRGDTDFELTAQSATFFERHVSGY